MLPILTPGQLGFLKQTRLRVTLPLRDLSHLSRTTPFNAGLNHRHSRSVEQSSFIELNWFRGGPQETMTFTILISELTFLMDLDSIMLSK